MGRYYDPFSFINRLFAEIDHSFRGIEDEWHVSLPSISVPSYAVDDTRIYSDGETEKHFKNGALHRTDGPAIIQYGKDGKIAKELYYIDGEKTTKENVEKLRQELEDKKIHTIYIGGKTQKITGKRLKELQKFIDETPKLEPS